MNRSKVLSALKEANKVYDVVVIGGGASGLGVALDAVTRGYSTVLLEKVDFAKGTSSRSTKLLHGGVRYLAQGNIRLVLEALKERGRIMKNAHTMVSNRVFALPVYQYWEIPFYLIGLKLYDILSGKWSLGKSNYISRSKAIELMPNLKTTGLKGAIQYHDGQFDDAELAISIARTAMDYGAQVLNHAEVTKVDKEESMFQVSFKDGLTSEEYSLQCKSLVNATGVFVDDILQMEKKDKKSIIAPSQGIHLVVDRSFWPSDRALMLPKTSDGRVLFGVPWHDKVMLGTTDTPVSKVSFEPRPLEEEIQFVLDTAKNYLTRAPEKKDVKSLFAGLRPLVAPEDEEKNTKEISRGHKVLVSPNQMITIIGGKWTTYRKMAEDVVDKAIQIGLLSQKSCETYDLKIHDKNTEKLQQIQSENQEWVSQLHPDFPYTVADVVYAIRHDMACTIEDVLSRRIRLLFLDAQGAFEVSPLIGEILQRELGGGYDMESDLKSFMAIQSRYLI
ncbi:glycerol-3-phosphate dehydrogenase/oxidase [Membranihabitans marinus]|uniref:glycerol-3-phosphate dehydrogenase/oxidase n=1 Tax=Membranihabitans marinus TaxID=1227546 RepID=UPI001F482BAC|nr:glycerol-3-phosphate dehydrogenase/oxidase [Membranihabitans marinus]